MARGVVGRDTGVFAPRLKGDGKNGKQGNFQDRATPSLPSFVTSQPTLPTGTTPPVLGGRGNYASVAGAVDAINAAWKAKAPALNTSWGAKPNPLAGFDELGAEAEALFQAWLEANQRPSGGGGGGGNPYTDAIKVLQQQISSGQYGNAFDRLSTQLGKTGRQAGRDIDAASLAAIAGLSSQDPMSQYTYAPSTAQIPQTALSNYLTSIGAGTNEVNANRDFLQQMINSENAQAMQFTNEVSQAQNAQRDAAIQAVYGNQAYARGELGTAQQAQEFAIRAAREEELKKLQDQILQYTLQGGKR